MKIMKYYKKKDNKDNKINDKIKIYSNINMGSFEFEKKNIYDDNIFKNKRKNINIKNVGLSQSTKVLNESDLNSILLKSTVYEYK